MGFPSDGNPRGLSAAPPAAPPWGRPSGAEDRLAAALVTAWCVGRSRLRPRASRSRGVGVALSAVPEPDLSVLRDPHRIAAARRLIVEVPGPAAFDRLSALAARLLGVGHAKVTLFTDQDTVVGGFGLPPGVVGGPALLTGALSAITVRQRRSLPIADAALDPQVAHLPAGTSGQGPAHCGAPPVAETRHVVGVPTGYDPAPRDWSPDEVKLLEQLAASVVAELELAAARTAVGTSLARLDVAMEASSIGIWEIDLQRNLIDWDQRCAAIFGLEGARTIPMDRLFAEHVHPDDQESAQEAMQAAIDARAQYTVELRTLHARSGDWRWTVSRGRVLVDADDVPVRILGTVLDVTEARHEAEARLAAFHRATAIAEVAAELANAARFEQLPEIVQRGAQVLGAQSSALAIFDPDSGPLRLHMTNRLTDEIQGHVDYRVAGLEIELDDPQPTQYSAMHGRRVLLADRKEALRRFPATREALDVLGIGAIGALPLRVEGRVLGSFVALWSEAHIFATDDVEVLEALAAQIALSVSRLQADTERATAVTAMREANERLQILAEAGRILSGSLEIDEQVSELAELVVPDLGDWCWLVVTDDQGRLHELASAHRDPSRNAEVEAYVRAMVAVMTEEAAARVVTTSGRPLVMPKVDWDHVERALPDPA